MSRVRHVVALLVGAGAAVSAGFGGAGAGAAPAIRPPAIAVDLGHGRVVNPFSALGTSIDSFDAVQGMTHHLQNGNTDPSGGSPGHRPPPGWDRDLFSVQQAMSPGNVAHLATSGLRPLSYRLVTELRLEDWHWSDTGTHSAGDAGYWTSTRSAAAAPITDSRGWDIDHGGTTLPGGENAYISRLDDGDPASFWKSNPYLDQRFTHEAAGLHPQWVVVDLGAPTAIDTVRIRWADPYAVSYHLQAWRTLPQASDPSPFNDPANGRWRDLSGGVMANGRGGDTSLPVGPTTARFLRVLLLASSQSCAQGDASDVRNCAGFAIRELSAGVSARDGFHDAIRHGNETVQSPTYASSNDPWESAHPARGFDQPGIDAVFDSGVTQGLPVMVPVPLLYSTPENAVALLRYLESKGRKIRSVEIGEEADGEYMPPEDYAALFLQWATAIHAFDPSLVVGGPALQDSTAQFWSDTNPTDTDYTTRLVAYLRAHHRLDDLGFFSFEQYPFFASHGPADDYRFLLAEPARTAAVLRQLHATVPPGIPLYDTEQSTFGESLLFGLWQADFLGAMFTGGLAANFNYQALPTHLFANGIAANLFMADSQGQWAANTATYDATSLLGNEWMQPVNAPQTLHPVAVPRYVDGNGNQLVSAYSVERPDGRWALLVINKSRDRTFSAPVQFGGIAGFAGAVESFSITPRQFLWHDRGLTGYASPSDPPAYGLLPGGTTTTYSFAPFSMTVLRGMVSG